jgi:3-dehydroquinate synthase class II
MGQPIDTETNIRKRVSSILAERLVRNAVSAIQAEKITPTRELVAQMVRMIAALRATPASIDEARLAVETINRTLTELEAGEWDERLEAMYQWADG